MTEERIKELAEAYALCLILPDRMDADASRDDLEELWRGLKILNDQLIRTVAAEARKEGIEEMERKGDQIIQAARSKPTDLRTISLLLHEEARQLKEKRK